MYLLAVFEGLHLLTVFKNLHLLEVDHSAVTAVVRTSEQAEVAAGFYQKMLDRNLVLRQILGPDGDGGYCFTDVFSLQAPN